MLLYVFEERIASSEITSVPRAEPMPMASKGMTVTAKPCLVHVGSVGTYASNMSSRICYLAQALGCMGMFGSYLICDSEVVNVEANRRALKPVRSGIIDKIKDFIKPVKRGKNFFFTTWGRPGYGKSVGRAIKDARYWRRDIQRVEDALKKHFETLGLRTRIAITEEGFGGTSLSQGAYLRAIARRFISELDLYIGLGVIGMDLPTQRNFKKYFPLLLERGLNHNAMVLYANWRRPLGLTNREIDYHIACGMLSTVASSLWHRDKLGMVDIWTNLMRKSPIIAVSVDNRDLPTFRKMFREHKDSVAAVSILTSMLKGVWHDPKKSLLRVCADAEELEGQKVFETVSVVGDVTREELESAEELAELPSNATTLLLSSRRMRKIYVTRFTPLVTNSPEIDRVFNVERDPKMIEEISEIVPVGRKRFNELVEEGFKDYVDLERIVEFPVDELVGEGWLYE